MTYPTTEGGSVPPTVPPVKRRPLALTVISILWLIGALINILGGLNTVSIDVSVLSYLSNPIVPQWFQFGVPAELAITSIIVVLGILQLITIYGLWTGRPWSYLPALAIPIISVIVTFSLIALYASAPASLGLLTASGVFIGEAFGSIIWAALYWHYIRRPDVKEYLGVKKSEVTGI